MNLERREFLKKAYRIGGMAALYSLGAAKEAMSWGVLPSVVRSKTSWAAWGESREESLAGDDTFVCLMENTVAGGNETGQGLKLSGSDLVLSQAGSIAGATGSPPTRVMDGSDDEFSMVDALPDAAFGTSGKNWTAILKIKDTGAVTNGENILAFDGANEKIIIFVSTAALGIQVQDGGVDAINDTTVNNIPTTGDVYFVVWYDGITIRGGMSVTKPTKLSDFDADDLVSAAAPSIAFETGVFGTSKVLFGPGNFACDAYYSVLSNSSLITD